MCLKTPLNKLVVWLLLMSSPCTTVTQFSRTFGFHRRLCSTDVKLYRRVPLPTFVLYRRLVSTNVKTIAETYILPIVLIKVNKGCYWVMSFDHVVDDLCLTHKLTLLYGQFCTFHLRQLNSSELSTQCTKLSHTWSGVKQTTPVVISQINPGVQISKNRQMIVFICRLLMYC